MDLKQNIGESDLDYHKRLVYGKLVDRTLSDVDYSELSEYVYGQSYSSDVARRMMYGSRKTLDIINDHILSDISTLDFTKELDDKMVEIKKERNKLADQRAAFNKIIREQSRNEEINELLCDLIKNGDMPSLDYIENECCCSDNDLLVSLNDIHYGIEIDNAWNKYNPDICNERFREYLDKILSVAQTHNSENCYVYNNGDSISGNIHKTIQIANKENIINQIKCVSELISQFMAELSKHFKEVYYISVSGNHSRLEKKDDAPIDERLDDLIEWYLEARLQNFDNIKIIKDGRINSSMYIVDVRGKRYCGVHGDFDSNPQKISNLQKMVMEATNYDKPVYAILSGHLHHNKIDDSNGVKNIMAGSFMGVDDLCIQRRIYGKPQQLICVCNSDGILCSYDITL